MSTSKGYHEYIGGCSVHRRDTMTHVGDIMSTLGDVQHIGVFNINTKKVFINLLPHRNHDIPRWNEHCPMYS